MSNGLPLEEQVIATLRRITRAIDLHSRLLLQKYGLTAPQLAALQAIHRLQPVTVGVIARQIHLSQATVTGVLGRSEKRGLVSRTRGDVDRRSVVVELTDDGARLVTEAPSLLQDRFHRELARLQEWERTMILATLQRIASMMDAEDIEAAPYSSPESRVPYRKTCRVTSKRPSCQRTRLPSRKRSWVRSNRTRSPLQPVEAMLRAPSSSAESQEVSLLVVLGRAAERTSYHNWRSLS